MLAEQLFRSGTFQEAAVGESHSQKGHRGYRWTCQCTVFRMAECSLIAFAAGSLDRLRKSLLRKEGQCLAAYSGEAEKPRCCLDPQRETGSMLQRSALLGQHSLGSAAAHVVVLSTCKS